MMQNEQEVVVADVFAVAERIRTAKKIRILTHTAPDGDALGSSYALFHAIRHAYPQTEVSVLCDDVVGERLSFLCAGAPLRYEQTTLGQEELLLTVDVADLSRLGSGAILERAPDMKIDHHAMGRTFASLQWVEPTAAACAEMIYALAKELDALTPAVCDCLYAGISSDTGGFRYENTTPNTHQIAADLIARGCHHAQIDHQLFESHTTGEVNALRWFWQHVAFLPLCEFAQGQKGTIAYAVLTNADKDAYGILEEDIGILASLTRTIFGVELGIVIKQSRRDSSLYKVSLRSGPSICANEICARLGGGGHIRAAGATVCTTDGQSALQTVLTAVQEVLA